MAWAKVKWIPRLFAAFDARWPARTRVQDGTIGDQAHQGSPSAHNPDDTPGSKPEREDSDSKAEVRGADVDARGVPMQSIINAILADSAERARFIYIIFNGWIWSAAYGWARRKYTQADQHITHAHFSGHPDHDEDDRPFRLISTGADMDLSTPVPEPLYSDFNGGNPDDAPTGLTVGQMLAQTHQHAWYARSAAYDALEIAEELKARPTTAVEPIDYEKLAKALLAEIN